MAASLAAVTQAPLTAFIIQMEMVDGHSMVLSLIRRDSSGRPLYDTLAENIWCAGQSVPGWLQPYLRGCVPAGEAGTGFSGVAGVLEGSPVVGAAPVAVTAGDCVCTAAAVGCGFNRSMQHIR
jgi:hypothetical protein